MIAVVRTLALMLIAPPFVLVILIRGLDLLMPGLEAGAFIAAGAFGLTGVVLAPWSDRTKAFVAVGYVAACIPALPIIALLASCSAGNCL